MTLIFILFLLLLTAIIFANKYSSISVGNVLANVVFLVVWGYSLVLALMLFAAGKALRTNKFKIALQYAVDIANESEHKIKARG